MTLIFNTSWEYTRMHVCWKFGDSSPNLWRVIARTFPDKPYFLEIWVKKVKMTLKVKVNDPYFLYQLRVSYDACLVQIWWSQLKSVTSYCVDKVKFTDRQTDRHRQRQYPIGLKAQGVKIHLYHHILTKGQNICNNDEKLMMELELLCITTSLTNNHISKPWCCLLAIHRLQCRDLVEYLLHQTTEPQPPVEQAISSCTKISNDIYLQMPIPSSYIYFSHSWGYHIEYLFK